MTIETQQASLKSKMDKTRLKSTHWSFWTCVSTSGIVKMMMNSFFTDNSLNDSFVQCFGHILDLCWGYLGIFSKLYFNSSSFR
jgi:hypothetical protein